MLSELLLFDGFKINIGEGAFYALFGFIFVFAGIALLVGIFTVLGIVMKKVNSRKPRTKRSKKGNKEQAVPMEEIKETEGISSETVAVIAAAIAAFYESENTKCDFVVKRIKRL